MVVTDADGIILWREGAARVRSRADALGFDRGRGVDRGRWSAPTRSAPRWPRRARCSCSPPSTSRPTSTRWYCTAAPIHDPRTGELLGIVDVSGPGDDPAPGDHRAGRDGRAAGRVAAVAAPRATARAAARRRRRRCSPRSPARCCSSTTTAGWRTPPASRRRPGSPCPDRERPLTVPGLGLCLPEPVADGWLVRPAGGETRIVMTLDLTGARPPSRSSGERPWRSPLTARHAEILRLLHRAGRPG